MTDEQARRIADAASAVLTATDILEEARTAMADRRFEAEVERERLTAAQQMGAKLESAAKRIDDALRKAATAGAVGGRPGVFPRYRGAAAALAEGKAGIKTAMAQDGVGNKRDAARAAFEQLEAALLTASSIVFGE